MPKLDVSTYEARENNYLVLKALVEAQLPSEYVTMIEALAKDIEEEDVLMSTVKTYAGLINAPAAKGNHHAYAGGLVVHLIEQMEIYSHLEHFWSKDPIITPQRVLAGVLIHDLHKAWRTFVYAPSVLDLTRSGFVYADGITDQLMTKHQKSQYLLNRFGIRLDLIQFNAFNCTEGGWAENPPKQRSTLASLLACLDEISGNCIARTREDNPIDLKGKWRKPADLPVDP